MLEIFLDRITKETSRVNVNSVCCFSFDYSNLDSSLQDRFTVVLERFLEVT